MCATPKGPSPHSSLLTPHAGMRFLGSLTHSLTHSGPLVTINCCALATPSLVPSNPIQSKHHAASAVMAADGTGTGVQIKE